MNITQQHYAGLVRKISPGSTLKIDCLNAFWTGGLICCIGQALTDSFTGLMGMPLKDARCLTSISLIFIAVLLTGLSLFDKIAKFAGAGTLVPITGFANSVAAPAIEFKSEGMIMGLGAKLFVIAGPVIVYGTVSSVLYGLVLCTVRWAGG